jgi:hypothetical protein
MFWHMDNGRDHGARKLLNYLNRSRERGEERERGLRNRFGEEMDREEREQFIERSEEYGHEKQVIFSPERGDELTDREMSLAVRKSMSEFTKDRPSTDYCFAIHRDTEHHHAQVALTGTREDLYTEIEERRRTRDRAQEHFREQERRRERERRQERERERQQEREKEREQKRTRNRGYGRSR